MHVKKIVNSFLCIRTDHLIHFIALHLIIVPFVSRSFPQTNYSFGYGFVNFVSEEGARQAIKTLNGITLRNKRLKVRNVTLLLLLS